MRGTWSRAACLALAASHTTLTALAQPAVEPSSAPPEPPPPATPAPAPAASGPNAGASPDETQPAAVPAPSASSEDVPPVGPIEVVVREKRRPRRHDAAAVTEISGDRLRESPRPSALEALSQETPGLYVSSRGPGFHGIASGASGAIHLRGLGGSPNTQVLIVEDGVPDYQGIFGHPIPDAYESFLVDRVRVVRGGDSVLYGTNALGAVIVIDNRRREREGFELENDMALGSYGTLRERAAVLARHGAWDVTSALSALRSDGHRAGAGGSNDVAHLSLRWRPRVTTHLTFSTKLFHGTGGDPGPVTHPYVDHWYDARRTTSSIQLRTLRHGVLLRLVPYLNTGVHRLYDGFYSRDHTAGAYAETEFAFAPGYSGLLGFAGDSAGGWVENRSTMEVENVEGLTNAAAYGQLTWQPWSPFEIVAGARGVLNTEYGLVPLYKLGTRVALVEGVALRSRLVRNFRQPTIRERYLPFPNANPNLEPEYSTSLDGGVSAEAGRVHLDATVFRTHSDNLIRYFGAWPTAEVVNIDEYVVYGVEGLASVRDLGPLGARASMVWQDVGRFTKQNPSHKLNCTVDLRQPLGHGLFTGELSAEWVAGLYDNNYQRDPLDDVFFIDVALRYALDLPTRKVALEPYLLVRNLLDLDYEYIRGYRMPGLNLLGGLKVTL
jgi:outer membrane cobalamin receptor